MSHPILQNQVEYYRARASEYDEWFYRTGRYDRGEVLNQRWFHEVNVLQQALAQIGKCETILELACGTGIWTQELLKIGNKIVAIDASQEMLEINRQKLDFANGDTNAHTKVQYQQQDLFSWQPDTGQSDTGQSDTGQPDAGQPHTKTDAGYDLVFFSFWLSHVPPSLLQSFLSKVYSMIRSGGQVFIIDSRFEPTSTAKNHVLEEDGSIYKNRKLNDGREFQVVKVFYQPEELQRTLAAIGFNAEVKVTENYFIYANGIKR